MLFAVEGGGFFSASASGYSKGLTLLLLGHRTDEKHMKVAPWNQYQLVDQDTDSELQLASVKNRITSGCASFVCFGCASAGFDGQSQLKVGPTRPHDVFPNVPTIEREKELTITVNDDIDSSVISLKSSLKKPSQNTAQTVKKSDEQEPLVEEGNDLSENTERRKVQWTDTCGKELAEIREFEMSVYDGSDDEFASSNGKTCSCRIM